MHVVDAYCLYKYTLKSKVQKITLLKFTKILALQLLHKNTENLNLNVHELDPGQLPLKEKIEEKNLKECGVNFFYKYYHICKDGVEHNLVKLGLRVGKRGKSYNKTNNFIVCKKKNIRRQTTLSVVNAKYLCVHQN